MISELKVVEEHDTDGQHRNTGENTELSLITDCPDYTDLRGILVPAAKYMPLFRRRGKIERHHLRMTSRQGLSVYVSARS